MPPFAGLASEAEVRAYAETRPTCGEFLQRALGGHWRHSKAAWIQAAGKVLHAREAGDAIVGQVEGACARSPGRSPR
jgi:hypothetical protein